MLVPGVRALFREPLDHVAEGFKILKLLAAAIAEENDNRHAPETLAGNAPVGTFFDHLVDPVFAPGGNPLHLVNFIERFLAQGLQTVRRNGVHSNEPLLGSTENYRTVATPAMRVTVFVRMIA